MVQLHELGQWLGAITQQILGFVPLTPKAVNPYVCLRCACGRAVPGPCGIRPRPRGAVWVPRSSCPAGLRAEKQGRPTARSMQSANPAFQRESFRHAFTGRIQKIRDLGASSIMAGLSVDSAGAASYGRRCEHEGAATIANHSAQELGAQLPCRPQYPRIRTDGKRTAHGVRVVYRGQEARER